MLPANAAGKHPTAAPVVIGEQGCCGGRTLGVEQATQPLVAQAVQKPADQRAGQAVPGGKGQAGILDQDRALEGGIGPGGLMAHDRLNLNGLDFVQLERLMGHAPAEQTLNLSGFGGVGGDKGEHQSVDAGSQ